jgi:hypothetical protein
MMRNSSKHMGIRRAVAAVLAFTVLAGPVMASAGEGLADPVEARSGQTDGYSLRHIPEALPLPNVAASFDQSEAAWYQDAAIEPEKELSMTRAILYSLLLPGLGELYAGNNDRAKAFFIVDGALWTAFIVFQIQGHRREDSYQQYAQTFAGIAGTGHSDDYYSAIGQFNSSDGYESELKKESRIELWPDVGYDAMESYYLENRVSDFEEWEWSSFDNRVDYRELRSSSKVAYRRSGYFLAAAALNRVIASLFAYQAVKSSRGELEDDGDAESNKGSYRLDVSSPATGAKDGFTATVSLIRSF